MLRLLNYLQYPIFAFSEIMMLCEEIAFLSKPCIGITKKKKKFLCKGAKKDTFGLRKARIRLESNRRVGGPHSTMHHFWIKNLKISPNYRGYPNRSTECFSHYNCAALKPAIAGCENSTSCFPQPTRSTIINSKITHSSQKNTTGEICPE